MSIRPALVHSCFDQARIYAFCEPFLTADITKDDLIDLWAKAAQQLGQTRPEKCRCSYRVTTIEAELLVKNGIADHLITDWRYNADKKTYFPAPNLNLVFGGKKAEDLGLIRSSLAAKTPRVQTIEKAHMERAYLDERQDEVERIEVWGELSRGVILDLTTCYPGIRPFDPFEGTPVIGVPIGWDPRTCVGKDVPTEPRNKGSI